MQYTFCPISQEVKQSDNEIWNIFLEKSYPKRVGGAIPRPFSKTSNFRVSLDQ